MEKTSFGRLTYFRQKASKIEKKPEKVLCTLKKSLSPVNCNNMTKNTAFSHRFYSFSRANCNSQYIYI